MKSAFALLSCLLLLSASLRADGPSSSSPPPRVQLRTYSMKEMAQLVADYTQDTHPDMRILMVQVLGEMGSDEAVRHLIRFFHREKVAKVRRAILVQLSALGRDLDEESFKMFKKAALKDEDPTIRFLALSQLSQMVFQTYYTRLLAPIFKKSRALEMERKNQIFASLILNDLGMKTSESEADIRESLTNPAVELRRQAALTRSLVERFEGDEERPSPAEILSKDIDSEVKANLARTLGLLGKPDGAPFLKKLFFDSSPEVRRLAVEAFGNLESSRRDPDLFLSALDDPQPAVRSQAIDAIKKFRLEAAAEKLTRLAEEDPDSQVRVLARQALNRIQGSGTDAP